MGNGKAKQYFIDDLLLDCDRGSVTRAGAPIKLTDLSFRLLLALAKAPPDGLNHEAIAQAVWGHRHVSDDNIKQRVHRLKRSLGDCTEPPQYILSVRGAGYRLLPGARPLRSTTLLRPRWLLAGVAGALAATMLVGSNSIREPRGPESPTSADRRIMNAIQATDVDALLYRAREYYYRFTPADNDIAIGLYQDALREDPDNPTAYVGLANAHAQMTAQYDADDQPALAALGFGHHALNIAPQDPGVTAASHKAIGLAYQALEEYSAAQRHYEAAQVALPDWSAPISNRGLLMLQLGELAAAYDVNIAAVQLNISDPIPYLHLANTYGALGWEDLADRTFNKTVSLKPDYRLAFHYRAQMQLLSGHPTKALALVSDLIDREQSNSLGYLVAGESALFLGFDDLATEYLQIAARSDTVGNRAAAQIRLARMHQGTTRQPVDVTALLEAISILEERAGQGRQNPRIWYDQTLARLGLGMHDEAIRDLQAAADHGWYGLAYARMDPHLAGLVDSAAFANLDRQITARFDWARDQIRNRLGGEEVLAALIE